MTVGALIQLQNGVSDRMAFLTFNPSISHFKSVYKRYTNFAMESISINPLRTLSLNFEQDTTITFKITRDGDLVRDIFLTFEFPDIYSNTAVSFQWIPRLAEYLVKDITLNIDNQLAIDKHYSEWFHINSEITLSAEKKVGYYEMIGNIPEYYCPASMNNGIYPSATSGVDFKPSIIGRKIILPLIFWFNKASSFAFPLIATQRMEFFITVTLRKLKELYTVLDSSGNRIQPTNSNFQQFLSTPSSVLSSLDITPFMETNFIYLEREERKRFALASHEYLITQLQRYETFSDANGATLLNIDLTNFSKPVTDLYVIIRRSDLESVNAWWNFTNWTHKNDISGSLVPYSPYRSGYDNPYGSAGVPVINSSNFKSYKTPYLLKAMRIKIQGQDIVNGHIYNYDVGNSDLNGKDSSYFNYIQPYMFQSNIPELGIYSYSFSINNDDYQPSGAINMSSISNKEIILNLTIPDSVGYNGVAYNYHVYIFAVNYEVVRILGGMFGTATAN